MSPTSAYLALSLPLAGLIALLVGGGAWLLKQSGVIDGMRAARGNRLQRKLDRRIARGSDRYFEERRSLEAAIERHEKAMGVVATPRRYEHAYTAIDIALAAVGGLLLAGFVMRPLTGIAPPAWSHNLMLIWIPLIALQRWLDSLQPATQDAPTLRFVAITMLLLATVMVGAILFGPEGMGV